MTIFNLGGSKKSRWFFVLFRTHSVTDSVQYRAEGGKYRAGLFKAGLT